MRTSGLLATEVWEPSSAGILSNVVYGYVGTNGWLPDLIALILILLQALLLNVLSARFRVSKEVTMFPGVFYILLTSTLPSFLHLSPVVMGNTFLIIGLSSLFNSYKKTSVAGSIFNVGFWFGMASLFYFSNFAFILLAIFGMATLRSIRINEIFMIIVGMIAPLFLLGTIFYLLDDLNNFYQTTFIQGFGFWNFVWVEHWSNYIPVVLFGMLILIIFGSGNIYFQKQSIRTQKNIQVLYYFVIISFLTVLIQKEVRIEQLLLLAIPFSLMLPLNFLEFRKREIGSGIHLAWLIGILFLHYRLLFM